MDCLALMKVDWNVLYKTLSSCSCSKGAAICRVVHAELGTAAGRSDAPITGTETEAAGDASSTIVAAAGAAGAEKKDDMGCARSVTQVSNTTDRTNAMEGVGWVDGLAGQSRASHELTVPSEELSRS